MEPGARSEMRGRERLAIDTAVACRTNSAEGVEVSPEAIGIDAKEHGCDANPDRASDHKSLTQSRGHTCAVAGTSRPFTLLL